MNEMKKEAAKIVKLSFGFYNNQAGILLCYTTGLGVKCTLCLTYSGLCEINV